VATELRLNGARNGAYKVNSHNSGRSDLRIQLLGPVRVRRGVHEVDLGSTQQKGLLSLLALAAGQQVSRYRLSRALWGPSPPSSWANALQVYVARLRRVLEPDRPSRAASRLLPSIGDGYALMVEPDTVDALRFRRLLHRAAVAHRRCATDVLTTDEPPTGRDAAAERLLDWYLTIAHGCCRLVNPRHDGVPPPAHPSSPPFRAEPGAALDYLTNEADNLPPVVRYAGARGSTTTAWRLAYLLFPFYLSRTRPADFLECARLGLQAAEHAGDRRARALMLNVAGVAANVAHRMADSTDLHREQIVSWQELGEPVREAGAWNNLGIAHAWLNQHGDALAAYQHALALADAAGDLVLAAIALDNIGDAARDLGDLDLSEQSLNRALETWRVLANLQGQGQALLGLARTAHFRSDNDTAMRCLTQAIELQRYVGDERMAALTLHWTGKARLDQGQTLAAKEDLQRAHALCRDMNDEHGESAVLTTLAAAYLQLDDFGAAHDCLLQAQTLRSHVPDPLEHGRLHYYISDLATRLGDSQRAITHLDQAIASLTGAGCIEARRLLQLITVAQNQDQGR